MSFLNGGAAAVVDSVFDKAHDLLAAGSEIYPSGDAVHSAFEVAILIKTRYGRTAMLLN